MAGTPTWSAARSGLLGDTGAVDASADVNQFLGAHPATNIYAGAAILTPNGIGGTGWSYHLDTYDIAQPFTMSGTAIGRVAVPLLPTGNGADLTVGLYANNSGTPGALITQTRIPAAWINQLAAVSAAPGPSASAPITRYTNNPLAVPQYNGFNLGRLTTYNPTLPTPTTTAQPTTAGYGSYMLLIGGYDSFTTTVYANTYTMLLGGTGIASSPVPQPSLPLGIGGAGAIVVTESDGSTTVVCAGGQSSGSSLTGITDVYTAQFASATGTIASWSTQAALPQPIFNQAMATWNGYVYSLGGIVNNSAYVTTSAVYYAQVSNGQIGAWNTAAPLPQSQGNSFAVASNGFLFVLGGTPNGGVGGVTTMVYAAINADGSLGPWQYGSNPPAGIFTAVNPTPGMTAGPYGIMAGNDPLLMLGVSADGPATVWQTARSALGAGTDLVQNAPGVWQYYSLDAIGAFSKTGAAWLTPLISAPLPATGLTNGATYHVVLSQPNGDPSDYLWTLDDQNVYSGNPTLLTRTKGSGTWTAGTSGHAVPLAVFDQTASGQPWHTWVDSGARISTLAYTTTPDKTLLGVLDAVAQPGPVLNQNWTFTAGTAPWAATGGTLTQSPTQIHGGLPFSGLLTPSGSAGSSYIESEQIPVQQGHSYTATAWLYSTPGYSNVAVNINWYDNTRAFISATSGTVTSLAAATWTQLSTTVAYGSLPATAAYGTIVVIETGTPANSKVLYVSAATLQDASGPMLATVSQITYPGTWPGTVWPPLGITQLA